ncbi:hypothetical protein [Shimia sp.]|uniref:hypothetical protein n=1 Tax=Shimia sp. TaxID=1954381 RepID=UPI00329A50AB
MVQYFYAENSDGEIIEAADIVSEDRHKYADLVCPGCKEPMNAAVGEVVESHFRHKVGEQCSDYFAQVIEKTITHSHRLRQENNQPYNLTVPGGQVVNLAKSDAVLEQHETNNRFRVDLRFRTEAGQIDVVVSRREADMPMLERMKGYCIGIDAQAAQARGEQNLVKLFKSGIDTNNLFVEFFKEGQQQFSRKRRTPPKNSMTALEQLKKQPGESTEDYRVRILGKH